MTWLDPHLFIPMLLHFLAWQLQEFARRVFYTRGRSIPGNPKHLGCQRWSAWGWFFG
jgi:hypothetical protein